MSKSEIEQRLELRVRELEEEVAALSKRVRWPVAGETVRVPEQFKPLFAIAQQTVSKFFSQTRTDPTRATIEISGERYVLMRASSLSVDFLMTIQQLYSDYGEDEAFAIGRNFLFDISHVIGMEDAKNFHKKMGVTDPVAKLSAGPVHFAYSGWAFVDISPESTPSPDENFFLKYDHPFSFEADSWIKAGKVSNHPVCIMNSGYSSGWCEESFGMPLTAVELTCKAAGDESCTFIMAPPDRIEEQIRKFAGNHSASDTSFRIPSFFERKHVEEEMKAARKKAEDSDRMKSEFLASMSHEIRTPMNGVIGMTELLLETELSDVQREYLEAARDSAESLMSIINQVLDFSRIEAGGIVLEPLPFDLRQMLEDTMKPFLLRAASIGIGIKLDVAKDVPEILIGDAGRLRQVIINLVGNAIKFTSEGNVDVRVRLDSVDEQDDSPTILFQVSDTGIGIPPDKLESIFEAFTQVDMSTTRRFGGTGLGLAISNQLVRLMNGRIWCENNDLRGSTFHFLAQFGSSDAGGQSPGPVSIARRESNVSDDEQSDQPKTLRILLAEDVKVNQKLALALLGKWGHTVTVANNGKEAVELWQRAPDEFDLILMDVLMPEMDGLEATATIRKLEQETGRRIRIVAITAQAMKGDRASCLDAGMDDYITKPIRRNDIQDVISRLF